MAKKPDLVSALPPLCPESIVDLRTGELVEQAEFETALARLAAFVQEQSQRLWDEHKDTLQAELDNITAIAQRRSGGRRG